MISVIHWVKEWFGRLVAPSRVAGACPPHSLLVGRVVNLDGGTYLFFFVVAVPQHAKRHSLAYRSLYREFWLGKDLNLYPGRCGCFPRSSAQKNYFFKATRSRFRYIKMRNPMYYESRKSVASLPHAYIEVGNRKFHRNVFPNSCRASWIRFILND